ncbi:PTS sugar transporter subunit IIA [Vagococcus humatus]|uniref:PTS galactitol transporter subunit IIA n=1 Tax=Vagococcus humatus TaxID=1889241 RepID=A0A429Z647_9ENTE|nr:PTS sugar transporter subunit IIA [Vagococcus humatus]RST89181.1 PTS galactitol transporter subunit IIA [Vagococcus humatus]
MFNEELILLNSSVKTQDELFQQVSEYLLKKGYVNEDYEINIKKREATFPTGINTAVCGVALPHTDSEYIEKPGICFVRTQNDVLFKEMVSNEPVQAKLFFFLLVKEKHQQVDVLSSLMGKLSDETFLNTLLILDKNDSVLQLLKTEVM